MCRTNSAPDQGFAWKRRRHEHEGGPQRLCRPESPYTISGFTRFGIHWSEFVIEDHSLWKSQEDAPELPFPGGLLGDARAPVSRKRRNSDKARPIDQPHNQVGESTQSVETSSTDAAGSSRLKRLRQWVLVNAQKVWSDFKKKLYEKTIEAIVFTLIAVAAACGSYALYNWPSAAEEPIKKPSQPPEQHLTIESWENGTTLSDGTTGSIGSKKRKGK